MTHINTRGPGIHIEKKNPLNACHKNSAQKQQFIIQTEDIKHGTTAVTTRNLYQNFSIWIFFLAHNPN